ncbi:MAG: aminopeptidase [Candidatus Odinarchaeota archaeon]|nr:aminopeptidase [Candidatus Odinarchaeota archaeon]
MDARTAAKNVLSAVLEAVSGERMLIISDFEKKDVADAFVSAAINLGLWVRWVQLEKPEGFRTSVPRFLQELVVSNSPDIIMNLMRGPAEEVAFRIQLIKLETRKRLRLAHCPGVTLDMLTDGALALSLEEYKEMQELGMSLLAMLSNADKVHVTNPAGTDVTFSVRGRPFFTDVMLDWKEMKWINIPVGEITVGPVENSLNGTLVADLAAGGIGPLPSPVTFKVKDGRVQEIESEDKPTKEKIAKILSTDKMANVIGEFAIGINKKARLIKEFLESEKVDKTVHFAFGNNEDFPGGKNTSSIHIDLLLSKPTVVVTYENGNEREIMKDGKLLV